MLFDDIWTVVKKHEQEGTLTVEAALDAAARLPQGLFCSMMEALAEAGEDPGVVVVQAGRLHDELQKKLREVADRLRSNGAGAPGTMSQPRSITNVIKNALH